MVYSRRDLAWGLTASGRDRVHGAFCTVGINPAEREGSGRARGASAIDCQTYTRKGNGFKTSEKLALAIAVCVLRVAVVLE